MSENQLRIIALRTELNERVMKENSQKILRGIKRRLLLNETKVYSRSKVSLFNKRRNKKMSKQVKTTKLSERMKKPNSMRNELHFEIQRKGGNSNVHKNKKAYDRKVSKNPKNW